MPVRDEAQQTRLVVAVGGRELDGVVRPGESLLAAARRTALSSTGEPVPVDLSDDPRRFEIDHDTVVTVRAMIRGDLPAVARWRAEEHVHRWWSADGDPTLPVVTARYGPHIDGNTATRMWVAEVNGRSIGFLQDYRLGDHPDFAPAPPDAVGVDYAIGEPAWWGRGLGVRMLWAWMRRAQHRFPDAPCFFAAPDHRNERSLRVLDKAGFTRGVWFDEPQGDGSTATVVGCTLDVAAVLGRCP